MEHAFVPGAFVVHPQRRDWGVGQVQSAIGTRVTVTFPEQGKTVIDVAAAPLILVAGDDGAAGLEG